VSCTDLASGGPLKIVELLEIALPARWSAVAPPSPVGCGLGERPEDRLERIYTNYVAMRGGAFDLAIDFGYRIGDDEPELLTRVAMSWEHAAAVAALLTRQIAQYEEQMGSLPDIERARIDQEGDK
jgi:hypothetical protein